MEAMDKKLREYARLLVEVGVNLQKGQTLVIRSQVDCAPFARLCEEAAYAAGAREVVMDWGDEQSTRLHYLHAADELFDQVPEWIKTFGNGYAEAGALFLSISSGDPEIFKDVDPERLLRSSRAYGKAMEPFRSRLMANRNVWSIGAIPVVVYTIFAIGIAQKQGVDSEAFAAYKIFTAPYNLFTDYLSTRAPILMLLYGIFSPAAAALGYHNGYKEYRIWDHILYENGIKPRKDGRSGLPKARKPKN